jgi:hypothetical protein
MTQSLLRRALAVLAVVACALLGTAAVTTAPAQAARWVPGPHATQHVTTQWAPAASAVIHPGTMMYTDGAQCTANFVYTDSAGNVYVGYAAHCAGTGGSTDTNGCSTGSVPLGTTVDFTNDGSLVSEGTIVGHGKLVYSSWIKMHDLGTTDANTCAYNDLALVKVDAADVGKVNPSVPFWGGPTGIDTDGTAAGDRVYTYGNSSLRAGVSQLSPHTGISLGDDAADGGWSHPLYTVTPGIPGDSGSAFLDASGKALGILSTVAIAPLAASSGVGDVAKELAYANSTGGFGVTLAQGTEAFTGPLLPI